MFYKVENSLLLVPKELFHRSCHRLVRLQNRDECDKQHATKVKATDRNERRV